MMNDEIKGKKINHGKDKKNPESTRLTIKTRDSSQEIEKKKMKLKKKSIKRRKKNIRVNLV